MRVNITEINKASNSDEKYTINTETRLKATQYPMQAYTEKIFRFLHSF